MSNLAKDGNTMDASWKLYDAERMANERLRQQLADTETQRVNWMMQCKRQGDNAQAVINELRQQLAASQGREVLLRDALKGVPIGYHGRIAGKECVCGQCQSNRIIEETLSLPYDTTALEAMIAKASEVMQERCVDACISFGESTDLVFGEEFAEEIRALPGVTLEDLQK